MRARRRHRAGRAGLPSGNSFLHAARPPCDDARADLRAEPDRRPGMNLRKTGVNDVVVPQGDRIGPDVYDTFLRLVLLGDRFGYDHIAVRTIGRNQNESDQYCLQ